MSGSESAGSSRAVVRYGFNTWLTTRWGAVFPYGTLFVNLSGSFVLCLVIAMLSRGVDVAPTPAAGPDSRLPGILYNLLNV